MRKVYRLLREGVLGPSPRLSTGLVNSTWSEVVDLIVKRLQKLLPQIAALKLEENAGTAHAGQGLPEGGGQTIALGRRVPESYAEFLCPPSIEMASSSVEVKTGPSADSSKGLGGERM